MKETKTLALTAVDSSAAELNLLSDRIWDSPETCYTEVTAVKLQTAFLREHGFAVEENLGDIPTAFSGSFGSGSPVIGILGEFDALSGLSQKAGVMELSPVEPGGNGHGCGHQLLGTASIGAALAVKKYLETTGASGTVIYYGCPAEEGGAGKGFMARDGVFDHLDCAVTWHPGDLNRTSTTSSLANIVARYKFHGCSAHAAGAPHLGRSALDAVTLMNVGSQFLREHVIQEARIHYAVTDTGGVSPNVVQADAEVLYMMRAPQIDQCREIFERIHDIARGAALMTGTTMEEIFVKATSNIVPNRAIEEVLQRNLEAVPLPEFDEAEMAFAKGFFDTVTTKGGSLQKALKHMKPEQAIELEKHLGEPYYGTFILPLSDYEEASPGSSDVGDVSWVTPTAQINTATWAAETPGHSWQIVAQGKGSIAHKAQLFAAKVMAGAVIDLLNEPETIEKAKKELDYRRGHKSFTSPIPKGVRPSTLK